MIEMPDLDVEVIRRRSFWSPQHEASRLRYLADARERIGRMFDDIANGMN